MKPGKLSYLLGLTMLLSPNLMVHAQFVAPVTADVVTGCSASLVENTGTSAVDDLQVIVWDGDAPGISFIDHNTSPATVTCFSLTSHTNEALVKDPDVVWDYAVSDLVLVVYEEHNGSSVSVWSQMWRWNGGSPVLETSYGTGGYYQLSQSAAAYPNVDADYAERAVAVWQEGTDIYAMTVDFSTLTPSGHHFWVNDNSCQQPGTQPDVAMRHFDDGSFVSFVYADPINIEIIVAQELYGTVQTSTSTCNYTQLQKPTGVTITYVGVPRIAMPNWDMGTTLWYDGWDAGVVYEGKNSSDYFIITSNRITHWSGWIPASWPWIPPYTWYCGAHTYSPPAYTTSPTSTEWISDILNVSGINLAHPTSIVQINAPLIDLIGDGSLRPVVSQSGDMITYNSWNWDDNGSQYSGYNEILMRRLMLHDDGEPINAPLGGGNLLIGNFYIPEPTDREYYLVSDAMVSGLDNDIISIAGTNNYAYFAFVTKGGSIEEIAFKRTVQSATAAVRKGTKTAIISAEEKEKIETPLIYPNPVQDVLYLDNKDIISSICISDLQGKVVWAKVDINSVKYSLYLNQNKMRAGIYLLQLTDINGSTTHHKILFKP